MSWPRRGKLEIGIHGQTETVIRALKVMALVTVQEGWLQVVQSGTRPLRQVRAVESRFKLGSRHAPVDRDRRQSVAYFPAHEAALEFAFERRRGDPSAPGPIPADASLGAMSDAVNVVQIIAEIRRVQIEVIDTSRRIGFTKRRWMPPHERKDVVQGESVGDELALIARIGRQQAHARWLFQFKHPARSHPGN